MRKIVAMFVMVFVMAIASETFALGVYPDYLGGDKNYVICNAHMGTGYYADLSSLAVMQYNPPNYALAINVVVVPDADIGKTSISDVRKYRFAYRYDVRKMYLIIDKGRLADEDELRLLNPNGNYAESGVSVPAGEIAFYKAYGIPFYGKVGYANIYGRI